MPSRDMTATLEPNPVKARSVECLKSRSCATTGRAITKIYSPLQLERGEKFIYTAGIAVLVKVVTPKCLSGPPVDRDRLYVYPWVRASDSRSESLGSSPMPPNTFRVHTEYVLVKSVSPNVLWVESRM
ncbi:hypothetical protein TNCV_1882531 [Trichonephila clavipes]|nr:hypothetical protein TNCV_1882531 [Trichonephila clavipes]